VKIEMIKPLSVVFASLWMALTPVSIPLQSGSKKPNADQTILAHFVGAWRVASLEEPGADGQVHAADCSGMLVYTADSHMSVQVMYPNPPELAETIASEEGERS